jgi:hypothetical protein
MAFAQSWLSCTRKYDGHLQTLPATWIESLVRKTLCPTGGAEEHRKTGSGSGIRRAHCGRHLGRLRFRPGTPVVISLSHVGRRASAMGPMAGRDRDTGNDFHRGGARAVAEEKIHGGRDCAVRNRSIHAFYCARRDPWISRVR